MSTKNILLCIFLSLIVTTALSAVNVVNESSGDNDVQELIASWVAMWNSYDLAMVDKLFLQDSRVSYFSSEKEGLIQGIDRTMKNQSRRAPSLLFVFDMERDGGSPTLIFPLTNRVDRRMDFNIMMENPLEIGKQKQPLRGLVCSFQIKEG